MNKNLLLGLGVFVAIVIVGIVLLNQKPKTSVVSPTVTNVTAVTEPSFGDQIKEITVTETEYSFGPKTIELKKGDKVKLVFKNEGGLPHDFVIDDLDLRTRTTSPGSSETLEFIADTAGKFTYYCGIGNHRDEGMEGILIVTE